MTTEQRSALNHMEGYPFPVLFSAGIEARAEQVAAPCERAFHYLKYVLKFAPSFRLLMLSPRTRRRTPDFHCMAYCMASHTVGGDALVVGNGPADFWQGVVRILDDVLTPAQRAELEGSYAAVDGRLVIARFADLIVVHELGPARSVYEVFRA